MLSCLSASSVAADGAQGYSALSCDELLVAVFILSPEANAIFSDPAEISQQRASEWVCTCPSPSEPSIIQILEPAASEALPSKPRVS